MRHATSSSLNVCAYALRARLRDPAPPFFLPLSPPPRDPPPPLPAPGASLRLTDVRTMSLTSQNVLASMESMFTSTSSFPTCQSRSHTTSISHTRASRCTGATWLVRPRAARGCFGWHGMCTGVAGTLVGMEPRRTWRMQVGHCVSSTEMTLPSVVLPTRYRFWLKPRFSASVGARVGLAAARTTAKRCASGPRRRGHTRACDARTATRGRARAHACT